MELESGRGHWIILFQSLQNDAAAERLWRTPSSQRVRYVLPDWPSTKFSLDVEFFFHLFKLFRIYAPQLLRETRNELAVEIFFPQSYGLSNNAFSRN